MKVLFLITLFFSSQLCGNEISLSVDDAVLNALKSNKKTLINAEKVKAAQSKKEFADSFKYPSLRFSSSYTWFNEEDSFVVNNPINQQPIMEFSPVQQMAVFKLTAQQTVFAGFRIYTQAEIAQLNKESAQLDQTGEETETIYAAKRAYWLLYKGQKAKEMILESIELVNEHKKSVENFRKNGLATDYDIMKTEVQRANLNMLLIDAETGIKSASMLLANITGMSLDSEYRLTSDPSEISVEKRGEEQILSSLESRFEILKLQKISEIFEKQVTLARAGLYPQVALISNYSVAMPNTRVIPVKEEFDFTIFDIGIYLTWDIWNWNQHTHAKEEAVSLLQQTKIMKTIAKEQIEFEIKQSEVQLHQSVEKVKAVETYLTAAAENHRITREKLKSGIAVTTDLIDAENLLLKSRIEKTEAMAESEIAKARYEKAVGGTH